MNTSNMRHPSGPECARYRSLLPQFRQGTLSPADERNLRAHLATCAYCRAQLATYDRLDAALRISLDRYTPTTPSADDLVRIAVARVSSAALAAMNHHQSRTPGVRQRENAMFDPRDAIYDTPTMPQTAYRPPRNTRTRPVLATIAALALIGLAAALFAMFARPSTSPAQNSTPTAALQPTATIQPTLAPTQANTQNGIYSGHPCSTDTSGQTSYVRIGDLQVSQVSFVSLPIPPMSFPPISIHQSPINCQIIYRNSPNPPVNPTARSGYSLTICNTSGATDHVLRGLTVRIATFSAYNGPLNTYMFCDTYYQRPSGVGGHGCGGGMYIDEQLQASFAADATTGAQSDDNPGGYRKCAPTGR